MMVCIVETYEDQACNQRIGITNTGKKIILGDIVSDHDLRNPKHRLAGFDRNGGGGSAGPFIATGFLAGVTGS